MSANMRAKVVLNDIRRHSRHDTIEVLSETLTFTAVPASKYPDDGSDEDNTYAKFTPFGQFTLHVRNPALVGRFVLGETYYVDFTPIG